MYIEFKDEKGSWYIPEGTISAIKVRFNDKNEIYISSDDEKEGEEDGREKNVCQDNCTF